MTRAPSGSDRVDAIRDAIADGTYEVATVEVAEAIMRRWSLEDVVEAFLSDQEGDSDAAASEAANR